MEKDELEKLIEVEQRAKSNSRRIDNLEMKVEDIHELASSVKLLASETKAMREDVNDMNNRLKVVEEKPLQNYEDTKKQIKHNVISFICGILLTALAMAVGLKKFL